MSFLQTFRSWVSSRWAIAIFDPLGPFVLVLLLLALATAAVVSTSGCGDFLPLLPSANVERVEPSRIAPGTTFEVSVKVSPDVSSCVLTVFGERSTCRVETSGCKCARQAPIDVGGAFVLEVTAATSAGIAAAKSTVVVDGAPPTIDSARVFVIRNPVGIKDAIFGEVGSVLDRPVDVASGAMIDVFPSEEKSGEPLASFSIEPDGSFGPIELEGTSQQSPPRVFVIVTDLLGNESPATEVVDARDDSAPSVLPNAVSWRRTAIGLLDQVHIAGNFVSSDDGCAMASHELFTLEVDPAIDSPLLEVPVTVGREAFVAVGAVDESFTTLAVVTVDKCGNRTLPVVIEQGADADLPTIDLRVIEAKRTPGAVRVVGGIQSVFDDTSAIRSVEIFLDDVRRGEETPSEDGAFEATVELEQGEEIERVSFAVVDKTGRRTLRVRIVALTTSTGANGVDLWRVDSATSSDSLIAPEVLERVRGSSLAGDVLAAVDGTTVEATGSPAHPGGYAAVDSVDGPRPRIFTAAAFDPVTDALVVVGGSDASLPALADSWRFVDDEWVAIWADAARTPPPNSTIVTPAPRRRSQMAFDPTRESIVMFGGEGEGDIQVLLSDTWVLDDAGWHSVAVETSPPPRASAALVTDLVRQKTILIGGECFGGECEDIWEWNGTTWRPHPACDVGDGIPSGRVGAQAAFDPTSGDIVLFGGRRGGVLLNDTWILDDNGWRELQLPVRPSPRAGGALFYDPSLRLLLLHGGEGSADPDEQFWAFVDGSWVTIAIADDPPPQRAWGVGVTGRTPTIGFGVSSRASIFSPRSDLWQGFAQAQSGAYARFSVDVSSSFAEDEVVNAVVTVHGGGTSAAADGFSVLARPVGEDRFDLVGLTVSGASGLESSSFPIAGQYIDDAGSMQLLIESRGATTANETATIAVDSISVDWRLRTEE